MVKMVVKQKQKIGIRIEFENWKLEIDNMKQRIESSKQELEIEIENRNMQGLKKKQKIENRIYKYRRQKMHLKTVMRMVMGMVMVKW